MCQVLHLREAYHDIVDEARESAYSAESEVTQRKIGEKINIADIEVCW